MLCRTQCRLLCRVHVWLHTVSAQRSCVKLSNKRKHYSFISD